MPETIPTVTKYPCWFPSTWREPLGSELTDKAIEQYAREGRYGPAEKRRQEAIDKARVVDGLLMLAKPCEGCKDGKTLGGFMRFAYLPKAGYYCNKCRGHYRRLRQQAIDEARWWGKQEAYE